MVDLGPMLAFGLGPSFGILDGILTFGLIKKVIPIRTEHDYTLYIRPRSLLFLFHGAMCFLQMSLPDSCQYLHKDCCSCSKSWTLQGAAFNGFDQLSMESDPSYI